MSNDLEYTTVTDYEGGSWTFRKKFNLQKCIQILREDSPKFKFIRFGHTDKHNGRCAIGVLLSHYGWDGVSGIQNYAASYMGSIHFNMSDRKSSYWVSVHRELGDTMNINIAAINDSSENFEEVINKLEQIVQ